MRDLYSHYFHCIVYAPTEDHPEGVRIRRIRITGNYADPRKNDAVVKVSGFDRYENMDRAMASIPINAVFVPPEEHEKHIIHGTYL